MAASEKTFDANSIRHDYRISDIAARLGVELKQDGREWRGLCPFHAEKTPSFTVFAGKDAVDRFQCFGCGRSGDVIEFVCEKLGVGFAEACEEITGGNGKWNSGLQTAEISASVSQLQSASSSSLTSSSIIPDLQLLPAPDAPAFIPGKATPRILNPKRYAGKLADALTTYYPSCVHPYFRQDSSLAGYVLRMELRGGGKSCPQIIWARSEALNYEGWAHGAIPSPKPPYRLPSLASRGQVLVLAGEKKSDQAARVLTKMIPISWAGGDNAWHLTDWSPVAGRSVVLWPDNDVPGRGAMFGAARRGGWREGLAEHLTGLGCQVKGMRI